MTSDRDIYREWLRQRLEERGHGAKTALAHYLGFSAPNAITRMLNTDPNKESRDISAVELARMSVFFGSPPPLPADESAQLALVKSIVSQLSPAGQREFLASLGDLLSLGGQAQSEQPLQPVPGSTDRER